LPADEGVVGTSENGRTCLAALATGGYARNA
jgi:hypothetical protein